MDEDPIMEYQNLMFSASESIRSMMEDAKKSKDTKLESSLAIIYIGMQALAHHAADLMIKFKEV
jgi:hypothetical protein